MEKQIQTEGNNSNPQKAKEIMLGLGIIAVLMVAGLVWISIPEEKEPEYQAMLPAALEWEVKLKQDACEMLKYKGSAKLMDDSHGALPEDVLNTLDRNVTAEYRDMDCSEVSVDIVF